MALVEHTNTRSPTDSKSLEFLKVWYFDNQVTTKFDDNYDYFPRNTTFLLDTNKKSLNPIEKYVYDITKFHMERIGTESSDCYVTFSLEDHAVQRTVNSIKLLRSPSVNYNMCWFWYNNLNPDKYH
jgi:hypothetical protein